ncbi:hypothetical protein [Ferruginibacter sp.]|nr:hypothetical protein [Ferruginibacter sp.]
MKNIFLLFFTSGFINCDAQVILTNGLIKAKIETHTENGGVASAINAIDISVYLKDTFSKVVENLSSMKSVRILDERKGIKTVLIEKPNGGKTGFTFTFADKALEKKNKGQPGKCSRANC